jgi:hypothetical protein
VDLEQFYNEDSRRRHSEELEFGRDWTDEQGRCEVSWVAETGELYAMREPEIGYAADGLGGMWVEGAQTRDLMVEVLGVVDSRDAIASVMSGWEQAMLEPNSLSWVRARVANAANEMTDPKASPSDDMPSN